MAGGKPKTGDWRRTEEEEDKRYGQICRRLTDHLNNSRYEEAYQVFSDEPGVLAYTNFAELSDMYLGLKNRDDEKAEEFRKYILKQVREWELIHGLIGRLKRLKERSLAGVVN